MSKELDEIKSIVFANFGALGFYNPTMNDEILKDRDKVLNYLSRFESIDNAKPGEAFEKLEELDNCLISDMSIEIDDYDESNYCMSYEYIDLNGEGLLFHDDIKEEKMIDFIREKKIATIKNYILKAQEQEKVLKIMKDKWVNVAVLIHSKTSEEYNNNAHTSYNLTQEDFELLMRWLG
jgi:hypothetical protein